MTRPAAWSRLVIALVSLVGAPSFGGCTCSRVDPEPAPQAPAKPPVAASSPTTTASSTDLPPVAMHSGKLDRDPGGHLKPTTPPPKDDPSQIPPQAQRDPDMDLDIDDPSRDYVARYVEATKRYGDKTSCVAYGKSYEKAGRRAVEVRDDPKAPCGATSDALRDTFLVDVGDDRMSLDEKKGHPALAKWPDGSDPDAKASDVLSYDDFKSNKTPLVDALVGMKLTVIRVQMYGRGTYPLVTLAGWRDPLPASGKPDDLKATTASLCAANANRPMSFVAGLNRSTTLRVRCPSGEARWDKL